MHNRKQTNAICDYAEAKDINQAVKNKRPPNSDGRSCTCIDLPFGIATYKMYIMNKDKVKIIRLVLMLTGMIEAYM